jgi:hypothetical protein
MSRLKLTVNEEKTRICKVPDGEFDFLHVVGALARLSEHALWPALIGG